MKDSADNDCTETTVHRYPFDFTKDFTNNFEGNLQMNRQKLDIAALCAKRLSRCLREYHSQWNSSMAGRSLFRGIELSSH